MCVLALHYPDLRRPSVRETLKGDLKNFVDVVLKREHSWTNTAIKCLISSAKQEGSPLSITGEKTQAGLINQRMSLTGWTFPFFTKYLNTCHHQIDGICWWGFGWHYVVMWIMCGEALREVKADMHMELEKQTGYWLSDLNRHHNMIISITSKWRNQENPQLLFRRDAS